MELVARRPDTRWKQACWPRVYPTFSQRSGLIASRGRRATGSPLRPAHPRRLLRCSLVLGPGNRRIESIYLTGDFFAHPPAGHLTTWRRGSKACQPNPTASAGR
jgi:hypothetical protein